MLDRLQKNIDFYCFVVYFNRFNTILVTLLINQKNYTDTIASVISLVLSLQDQLIADHICLGFEDFLLTYSYIYGYGALYSIKTVM